jgi:hypothetical protein
MAFSAVLLVGPITSAVTPAAAAGLTDSPAVTLRTNLNLLAQEHVYLAGAAIDAALGGRQDEFQVAAAATDQNSQDLAKAVGSIYGPDAQQTFLSLWRAHIGFFVDYTQGAATKDAAKMAKARADLDGYRQDIDAFFTGANPNLPKGAVAQLFVAHVQHLTGAIDMLAAGDLAGGYGMLRMAAQQTPELMNPLAEAIAMQLPQKFPTTAAPALVVGPAPAINQGATDGMKARDGKSLDLEPAAVRSSFISVWSGAAPTEWVKEHNAELTRIGR